MEGKRNQFNIRKLKTEKETKTGEDVKTIDIVNIFLGIQPSFTTILLKKQLLKCTFWCQNSMLCRQYI